MVFLLIPQEARRKKAEVNGGFDPEGGGYDYASAREYGLEPDETGHWPSRVPETGLLLKGKRRPTWHKTVEADELFSLRC